MVLEVQLIVIFGGYKQREATRELSGALKMFCILILEVAIHTGRFIFSCIKANRAVHTLPF